MTQVTVYKVEAGVCVCASWLGPKSRLKVRLSGLVCIRSCVSLKLVAESKKDGFDVAGLLILSVLGVPLNFTLPLYFLTSHQGTAKSRFAFSVR